MVAVHTICFWMSTFMTWKATCSVLNSLSCSELYIQLLIVYFCLVLTKSFNQMMWIAKAQQKLLLVVVTQTILDQYTDKLQDQPIASFNYSQVSTSCSSWCYVNNAGICIEHRLLFRKKWIKIMLLKQK